MVSRAAARATLILGCTDCMDAAPVFFDISRADARGFAGRWHDPETGTGVAVDERGPRLPDPEGYYCAVRIDVPAPSLGPGVRERGA